MKRHLLLSSVPVSILCCLVVACSASPPDAPAVASGDVTPLSGGSKTATSTSTATACWDGVTLPRPAYGPTPLASVSTAYAAYDVALAQYQTAADTYSVEAQAHAAAYNAAAQLVTGQPCATDVDCGTGSPDFPGFCLTPYYGHAQCEVRDAFPLPLGPQPPPQPVFTCADFTCASLTNYACALEQTTGALACVLSRCSTNTGGANSGGGGGGSSGGGSSGGGGASGGW
jgi:uncharacterized membrane protein YgcG